MSDHEEIFDAPRDDTRYSTPVPEFDDHRHQFASVPRPDRSRRGTVDTLYGSTARNFMPADSTWVNEGFLHPNARDFEYAVVDGDSGAVSPAPDRSRRPTIGSIDRDVSPPNSMKAFAQARRRDREVSAADPNSAKAFSDAKRYDGSSIHRTLSANSRRSRHSLRSRRYTNDNEAASMASSTPSVEEDVCFPQQVSDEKRDKRKLYIDFDYLERFIAEEERDRTPLKNQPQPRVFNVLRTEYYNTNYNDEISKELSGDSSLDEKAGHPVLDEKFEIQQHADLNRFSFFSSAWESTIHAAEFKDLIIPGESIRGLFTFPENEQDGVWWLNMVNLTEEEIRPICRAFGIHPLTIEDIQTQETREKVELFPSYYFACFRSFHSIEVDGHTELEPYNVYVIVFREGILTFSFAPNPHAANVRRRIASLQDYLVLNSDWICYALM
jgi:magnesium transporter